MLIRYVPQIAEEIVFSNNYMVYIICLLPSIVSYITLSICYKTAFYYDRFPEWVYTPWISFTGVNKPESNIFAMGLTFAGICIILVNYIFTTKLMHNKHVININNNLINKYTDCCHSAIHKYTNKLFEYILSYFLIIASFAVTIQSWINVDNDMLITFLSPKMQTMQWYPTYDAVIHIGCAAIFFFGCILYHNLAVILTFNYNDNKLLRYSFYYKIFMLIISCIAGLGLFWNIYYSSYIVDPYKSQTLFHFFVNGIGFCQYVITICDCLFVVSYGWDYFIITNGSNSFLSNDVNKKD